MLYESLINIFQQQSFTNESCALKALRKEAFLSFQEQKFPTVKNEEYRFTPISFVQQNYTTTLQATISNEQIKNAIDKVFIKNLDAYRLVKVNGKINFEFSILPTQSTFIIKQVKDLIQDEQFAQKINYELPIHKFPFAALNSAFFSDGYFIDIQKGCHLDKPLEIIHVFSSTEDALVQPRNFIHLEENSSAEIIESFYCIENVNYIINSVIEIKVASNALCKHIVFQKNKPAQRFINHTQVTQEKDSHYKNYTVTIPESDFVRNNLNVVLNGTHTETHMYGLYLAGKGQLIDNHSWVDHRFPHCESNQLYKGVLLNDGKGVFNGKIHVHRPAQKTNAFQQNNNLLYSPNAQINTKPQLEIFADDVKCSHGSTIGQFSKEATFYLRARGIGEETAKTMLVNAFAFDVTEKIDNEPLRAYIDYLIEKTIAEANNK